MKKGLPAWITLGLIALVAGLLLGFTNELTAPVIQQQTRIKDEEARRAVLAQAEEFQAVQLPEGAGLDSCYQGLAGGETVGYVAQATTKGYGGEIQVTVGMDTAGIITGISDRWGWAPRLGMRPLPINLLAWKPLWLWVRMWMQSPAPPLAPTQW